MDVIKTQNRNFSEGPSKSLVGVFLGGTNGIGEAAMLGFVKAVAEPVIFFSGRSGKDEVKTNIIDEKIKKINPKAEVFYFQHDLTLLNEVVKLSNEIKNSKIKKVNYLHLSQGYLGAKLDLTSEGLDKRMVLYYYGRFKMTYNLIPLLQNGYDQDQIASVINVLGAGNEGFKYPEDIGLDEPEHFGFMSSNSHSITLNSLATLKFANIHPDIRFNHINPGLVNSGSKPYLPWYTRYLVEFALHFFGITISDISERLVNIALLKKTSSNGQLIDIKEQPVSTKNIENQTLSKKAQEQAWHFTLNKISAVTNLQ
ncbi:unnamed protein product [Debaryomyces tyrocola]|nr:unnamed protein product [Debaryomyces tyrocola]